MLLRFPTRCLWVPSWSGLHWSLTIQVGIQLREELDPPENVNLPNKKRAKAREPLESFDRRVSIKLEEGDFKGAVRLTCSEDSKAVKGKATFKALKDKYPLAHRGP